MEGVASYIDDALLGGVLTALLILVAIGWLLFLQNWLWRAWLEKEKGQQFRDAAKDLGLAVGTPGFRPRLRAAAPSGQPKVILILDAGWRGARVALQFRREGKSHRYRAPLESLDVTLGEWAKALLASEQSEHD